MTSEDNPSLHNTSLHCSYRRNVLLSRRFRRDPRDLDDEEEMWFNNEDEECDDCDPGLTDSLNYKLEQEYDQFNKKALERSKNLG